MNRWPTKQLSELVVRTEQRDPTQRPDEEFVYVDISAVDNASKEIRDPPLVLGAVAPSRARKVMRAGDVIVATVRPALNAVALVPASLDDQICSTGFCVLRTSKHLNNRYLFYFSQSPGFVDHLVNLVRGASYPAVTESDVKDTLLPLPSMPEQERIVGILDEAAALRRLRTQADERTSEMLASTFRGMFDLRSFRRIPLEELTSLITSGVTPLGGEEVYVNDGPYFIRSQNVQMNHLDLSTAACLPPDVHRQMARTRVVSGDVLLNITGASIGRVAWVNGLDREANVSQHVCLIRPKPDLLNTVFLSVFISLPSVQHFILQVQAGASRQALNHQQVRALEIPVPPIELQRAFAAHVAEIRALQAAQATSHQRLGDLFQSLLHRAFQGEL